MPNPIFNALNGGNNQNDLGQRFQRFLGQMKGKNANQEIQQLLQSGQITQQQLNQAQQMAQQMQGFFSAFRGMLQ